MSQPTPTTNFKHRKEQHGLDHFKVHTGFISCAPGGSQGRARNEPRAHGRPNGRRHFSYKQHSTVVSNREIQRWNPPPLTRRTRVEAAAQYENCERPADDDPSTRNGEPGTRRTLSTDAASGPTTATQDDAIFFRHQMQCSGLREQWTLPHHRTRTRLQGHWGAESALTHPAKADGACVRTRTRPRIQLGVDN